MSTSATLLHKIRGLHDRLGVVDALLEGVSRPLRFVSSGAIRLRRYYLFSQPVAAIPAISKHRAAAITVRRVEASDAIVATFPRPGPELAARFAAGSHCLAGQMDGKLVGFLWLHFGAYDDPEIGVRFVPLPSGSVAWDFDVYVAPQHRGTFAFSKLWSEAGAYLRERGIHFSVSMVWANNDDSIRSHLRLGAYAVGSSFHLGLGKRVLHIADRKPRIAVLRAGAARPEMDVAAEPSARKRYRRFQARK